jgi:hypothetical protein
MQRTLDDGDFGAPVPAVGTGTQVKAHALPGLQAGEPGYPENHLVNEDVAAVVAPDEAETARVDPVLDPTAERQARLTHSVSTGKFAA